MSNLTDLAKLVCGSDDIHDAENDCEISEILKHLNTIIWGNYITRQEFTSCFK